MNPEVDQRNPEARQLGTSTQNADTMEKKRTFRCGPTVEGQTGKHFHFHRRGRLGAKVLPSLSLDGGPAARSPLLVHGICILCRRSFRVAAPWDWVKAQSISGP